jgi:hypothetical protein
LPLFPAMTREEADQVISLLHDELG